MTTTAKLRTGMRMSLDDFLALGETDGKWELDDGVLYIMASGSPDHQFCGARIWPTNTGSRGRIRGAAGRTLSRNDHDTV